MFVLSAINQTTAGILSWISFGSITRWSWCVPSVMVADWTNEGQWRDTSKSVLQLILMLWAGRSNQGNCTGGDLTYHWWITPEPQKQRPCSHCQCGLIPQTMRILYIQERSSNASARSGKSKLSPSKSATAEAEEADKVDDGTANKDDSKPVTSKSTWFLCHLKRKKKEPSKRIELVYDSLNDYFGLGQS